MLSVQLAVVPKSAQVVPGARLFISVTIHNSGAAAVQAHIDVLEIAPEWFDLATPDILIAPNGDQEVPLIIQPPANASFGRYSLSIDITSEDGWTTLASANLDIYVHPVGAVDTFIQSAELEGIDGAFRITLTNKSEWPTTVTLEARDRSGQLHVVIEPETPILLAPNASTDAALGIALNNPDSVPYGRTYIVDLLSRQTREDSPETIETARQVRFTFGTTAVTVVEGKQTLLSHVPLWAILLPLVVIPLVVLALQSVLTHSKNAVEQVRPTPTAQAIKIIPTSTVVPTHTPSPATATSRPTRAPAVVPVISSFALAHTRVGTPYSLQWHTLHASSVQLNTRPVAKSGHVDLSPPIHNELFTLSAAGGAHHVSRTIHIAVGSGTSHGEFYVLHLPAIETFSLHRVTGGVLASWRVANASLVTVQGKHVAALGQQLEPSNALKVTLVAHNDVGSQQKSLRAPAARIQPKPRPSATAKPRPTATARPRATPKHTATPRPTPKATSTAKPVKRPTAVHKAVVPTPKPHSQPSATPHPSATPRPTVAPLATARPTSAPSRPTATPPPPTVVITG